MLGILLQERVTKPKTINRINGTKVDMLKLEYLIMFRVSHTKLSNVNNEKFRFMVKQVVLYSMVLYWVSTSFPRNYKENLFIYYLIILNLDIRFLNATQKKNYS